jgi:hypothetical protein
MIFFVISIGFFKAHYESGYEEGKANQIVCYMSTTQTPTKQIG